MNKHLRLIWLLAVVALLTASCATGRNLSAPRGAGGGAGYVKDNRPQAWTSNHPRVRHFRDYYARTTTVETALERGRRYMPTILREFRRRNLPTELAYLPMLESLFDVRADSGSAKGMWQFTPQTAEHMGLRVGFMVDERLNWRKATEAAAEYLDRLGAKFNYNWELALAAYNGGPAYIERAMRSQHTWNFYELRLRKETAEYVPRFIAMLQVARRQHMHLVAGLR